MENKIELINLKKIPTAIAKLANWHHNQWSYLNPGKPLERRLENMEKHLNDDVIPTTFVAMDGEVIVGSACLIQHDMDDRLDLMPWLASVFVDPELRKSGTGTRLVKKIIELARDNGYKEFFLYTPDKEKFYKKIGWETLEKRSYHNEDVTIMRFDLLK